MKVKINKEKICLILFCTLIATNQISSICLSYNEIVSSFEKIYRYILYIGFLGVCVFNFKKDDINVKISILVIVSVLIAFFSGNKYVLINLLVITAMKNIKFEKILKYAVPTNIIIFLSVVLLSLIGIIPNWSSFRGDGTVRYYLGYQYATVPATYFFTIVLVRFYQKGKDIKWFEIIFEFLISLFLYVKTDSKTGFILTVFVIIMIIIIKLRDEFKKRQINFDEVLDKIKGIVYKLLGKVGVVYSIIFPVFIVGIVFLSILMYRSDNSFAVELNNKLAGRISYADSAIKKYGITAFGSKVKWYGWGGYGYTQIDNFEYNFVDDSYIYILIDCGCIFLALLIYGFIKLLINAVNKSDYKLILAISIVLIWSIIEPNILNIDKNLFLILFSSVLFDKKEKLDIREEIA